jgi:mannose-1-phosphate guanylyltransferase
MKAVVLVGGFGTRLRPLTLTRPKQMLPVVDRPMIEWVVEGLVGAGVDEVVLSLGYLPDAFVAAYPDDRCAGAKLRYAVEPEPLDTAGAIRFAARYGGLGRSDDPFLVVNGDVVADLDIGALVDLHRRSAAEATIALTRVDDPSRYGVVPITGEGRVEAFIEKPPVDAAPTNWINAGTYVLDPAVLERIPEGRRVSIERETFPALVDEGRLFARQDGAYWIDAGTPGTYLQLQLDLLARRAGGSAAGYVDPSARLEAGARVATSVVMARARIGAGAELECAVILPGAHVGEGACLRRSIVGEGARIGSGAVLRDLTVVGDGEEVADGAVLDGVRTPAGA